MCKTFISNKVKQASLSRPCKVCGIEKVLEGNFKFNRLSDTYSRTCNVCNNEIRREYYKKSGDRVKGSKPDYKECPNCKITYSYDKENFYYRTTVDTYSSYCKNCAKDRKRIKKERPPQKEYTLENKAKGYIERYTRLDKRKALETELSLGFLLKSIKSPCIYCGFSSTGLDRIDNDFGHTEDNCVPCCGDCNIARNQNFSHNEMLELGKTIREIKLKRI